MTVAVTGATGDVGTAVLAALEREPRVARVRAMARGPFDPGARGLVKVDYSRGDVRNRRAVRGLLGGADAVIHLAFVLHGRRRASDATNLDGSRIVFEEAVRSGAARICCASSIGGYRSPGGAAELDEGAPFLGGQGHVYGEQKAEMERLLAEVLAETGVAGYALRLSIVAGPAAQLMLRDIPYFRIRARMPARLLARLPGWLRPVLPDSGVPLQLVHEDDAAAAFVTAALDGAAPGAYNLAGPGTITVSDLARQLGWRSFPLPAAAVRAAASLARRLPPIDALAWLELAGAPVVVRTERAREELGWSPRFSAAETLRELVEGHRRRGAAR